MGSSGLGTVRFGDERSSITISRPAFGVVVLTIVGKDAGQHGQAPFEELAKDLARGPFALFVDASKTQGATMEVSNVWARWLKDRRDQLIRIHMLTGSKFVQLTADFVRRWADLGDAMLVYTDAAAFDEALKAASSA
jgi:hypothetical protein